METVKAKVRVFVSNISSLPLSGDIKDIGFRIFLTCTKVNACVQQKFESVYLHIIKKHRNINLLFSYYEVGFRCFELNLFSHCFDSVRFEIFKPEQALRTLDWKDSLFTRNSLDLTKCCLCFQIRQQRLKGRHTRWD